MVYTDKKQKIIWLLNDGLTLHCTDEQTEAQRG